MLTPRGFTLIELLVVIAIIGILASVVFASLNSARDKGSDAAVKSNLVNNRAQAELYYTNNLSYEGLCTSATGSGIDPLQAAADAGGLVVYTGTAGGTTNRVVCHDTITHWGVQAYLAGAGLYFCMDSSGAATTSSTNLIGAGNDVTC